MRTGECVRVSVNNEIRSQSERGFENGADYFVRMDFRNMRLVDFNENFLSVFGLRVQLPIFSEGYEYGI